MVNCVDGKKSVALGDGVVTEVDSGSPSTSSFKVFLSYARRDLTFVDRLAEALRTRGIEPVYDRAHIEKFAVWGERIEQLIVMTDTVVFVISPDSVESESCSRELEFATRLNKRLAPVVAREVADDRVPPALARINFIFFRPTDDFAAALDDLVVALQTDIEWIREHTRLGDLARRWEARRRADDLLLRGAEVAAAAAWMARQPAHAPAPTELHRAFIENAIRQIVRRVSAHDEKIRIYVQRAEFEQAQDELDQAIASLTPLAGSELAVRLSEFEARRARIERLLTFYECAKSVYVAAGEEEFDRARDASERGLAAVGVFENPAWWEHLPADDLTPRETDRLKYEVHRQLLLLSALRLQPGIRKLTPASKPSFDVMKLLRYMPGAAIRAFARAGGLELLPALRRQDKPDAAADFHRALATLEPVRAFESAQASDAFPPSRTSALVRQMAGLLLTYASGPRGEKIGYRLLLAGKDRQPAAEGRLNPADHYFLGLFNFFIAKRQDAPVAKLFGLFQGVFPDLDMRTPYDTAERLLRAGVSREPENFWPHFVLGRTLLSREDFRGAELAFNVCISIFPDYARGYEQRAVALARQWKRDRHAEVARRAEEDSRRALELAGGDPSTYWPRGELLADLGDLRGALDAYARWMELEEDVLGKLSRGTGVQNAHDFAAKLLRRRAAASDPALKAECLGVLAIIHRLWGEDAEAESFAGQALDLRPDHPHAHTVKGMLLQAKGALAAAIDEFDAALRADPAAWLAGFKRAEAYERLGDGAKALVAWQDLLTASPEDRALPTWMRRAATAAVERLQGPAP